VRPVTGAGMARCGRSGHQLCRSKGALLGRWVMASFGPGLSIEPARGRRRKWPDSQGLTRSPSHGRASRGGARDAPSAGAVHEIVQ